MNDLQLPPAYQTMLKQACERAYKKGIRRGKRIGHTNGHAAGRNELMAGLTAIAKLNGSAQQVMKSFNPDQPRNKIGEWTSGAEVAEAAADPAKAKELAAGMDSENKAKLAAAIDEHKGESAPKDSGLSSASTAADADAVVKKLGHIYRASGGLLHNDAGAAKAVEQAAAEIGKLNREELTKLKESWSVKAGGKKAEIATRIAQRIIFAIGAAPRTPAEEAAAKAAGAAPPPAAGKPAPELPAPEKLGHDIKIPKDKKRLSIDQANSALKKMGYSLGKSRFDFKTKQSVYELNQPDGSTSHASIDEIREIVYRGAKGEHMAPEPRPETRALMGHGEGEAAPPIPSNTPPETPEAKYARSDLKAFAAGKPMSPLAVHDETAKAIRGEYGVDIQDAVTSITAHPEQYNTLKKKQDAIRRTLADTRMPAPAAPAEPAPATAVNPDTGSAHKITSSAYWIERRAQEGKPLSPEVVANLQAQEKAGVQLTGGDVQHAEQGGTVAQDTRRPPPNPDGEHFVAGGNTYQHRQAIAKLGGRWDPQKRRWIIPAHAADKLPGGLKGVPL